MTSVPAAMNRARTGKACDYCRGHKLRCAFLVQEQACRRCLEYGIPCRRTGQRLKRMTGANDDRTGASIGEASRMRAAVVPESASERPFGFELNNSSTLPSFSALGQSAAEDIEVDSLRSTDILDDMRYMGSTSLSALISDVTTRWPVQADSALSRVGTLISDHNHAGSVAGSNFLMVPQQIQRGARENAMEDAVLPLREREFLLLKYQTCIAPAYPILSTLESTAAIDLVEESQPVKSIHTLGLALLAATSLLRETTAETRNTLVYHIRRRLPLKMHSSIEGVQVLLLLTMCVELLSPNANLANGLAWNYVGLAIRMSLDLGLHQNIAAPNSNLTQLNRRARVWAVCLVADRWFSLCHGQPVMISLDECDAPGPSPFHDDVDNTIHAQGERPYELLVESTKLAILLGRLLKFSSPGGRKRASKEDFRHLKTDLDSWIGQLPYRLHPASNTDQANILLLFKVVVDLNLYRAMSEKGGSMLELNVMADRSAWNSLAEGSTQAIQWINDRGSYLLDSGSAPMYCLVLCALVHFNAAGLSKQSLDTLQIVSAIFEKWSRSYALQWHTQQVMTLRGKITALVNLLSEIGERHWHHCFQNANTGTNPAMSSSLDVWRAPLDEADLTSLQHWVEEILKAPIPLTETGSGDSAL